MKKAFFLERKRRALLINCSNNITEELARLDALEEQELQRQTSRNIKKNLKFNSKGERKPKEKISHYFLLNPEGLFLRIFDPLMILVIMYVCITSGFYIMFGEPNNSWDTAIDWVTFFIFSFDIAFNCCRQYRDIDGILVKEHK